MNYEVKVKYNKIDENGKDKLATEVYLVQGQSFGDVESVITTELEPLITGSFSVEAIKKVSYIEIVKGEEANYYKVKVSFITIDEVSAKEVKTIEDLEAFAEEIKMHPGVIIGRLQHEGAIHFSEFNEYKVKIELFD